MNIVRFGEEEKTNRDKQTKTKHHTDRETKDK